MFDVGFWELSLIGVLGLLILGPERLPVVARTLGGWVRRSRRYLRNFAEEVTGDESISELRSEVQKLRGEIEDVEERQESGLDDEPIRDEFDEKTGERRRRQPPPAYSFDTEDIEPAAETNGTETGHKPVPEPVATAEHEASEDEDAVYARARRSYLARSASSARSDETADRV